MHHIPEPKLLVLPTRLSITPYLRDGEHGVTLTLVEQGGESTQVDLSADEASAVAWTLVTRTPAPTMLR